MAFTKKRRFLSLLAMCVGLHVCGVVLWRRIASREQSVYPSGGKEIDQDLNLSKGMYLNANGSVTRKEIDQDLNLSKGMYLDVNGNVTRKEIDQDLFKGRYLDANGNVTTWPPNITDPTTVSSLDLDEDVEKDLNICRDLFRDNSTTSSYYHTLKNRLDILREYIPANFSTEFKNPCWYDFHQKPTSPLIRTPDCYAIMLSYNTKLTQQVLEQVKRSGARHLYCLPAFFLIGFPKCGTTTLYKMIIKHPLIADTKCRVKENQFWSMFMNKHGTALDKKMQTLHYLNYFSQSIQAVESNPQSEILDGTVTYLIWTTWTTAPYIAESEFCLLPSLFRHVLPQAKFVVVMRNPTERTFSHYYFYSVLRAKKVMDSRNVNHTKVSESFHKHTVQAIMKFQSCVSGNSVSYCVRQKDIDGNVTNLDGYVGIQTSLYYYHIVPWLSIIPRERFLFLRTEDLAYAQQLTMTKVWNFLNFYDLQDYVRTYENVDRRVDGLTIPPQTKKVLDDFFRPYNQLLANLLSDMRYLWND